MNWSNFPFAPKRVIFFYGWVIVGCSVLSTLASIPGQTMGVGVFTDHLINAWDINRNPISLAYMIGTICSAFILPFAGKTLDRIGTRNMMVVSAFGLAFSMICLSRFDIWIGFTQAPATWKAMMALTIGFLLVRFWGQGCLALVGRVAIGQWFNRNRGKATAIAGMFTAFGFNGGGYFLNLLVEAFGWRMACTILALILGGGVSVLAWLLMRDTPEACGLEMDGGTAAESEEEAKLHTVVVDFTRNEAVRTLPFWAFSLSLALQGLIVTALTFHVVDLSGEMDIPRDEAFSIFWPYMPFIAIAATLTTGWLSDRIELKWLLFTQQFSLCMGIVATLWLNTPLGYAVAVTGYGISGGHFGTLVTVVWPRFYGRAHLGAISGFNMSIMVFASAIGPIFFSSFEGITGSYREVIALSAILPLSLLFISFKADNPQFKYQEKA